LCLMRSRYFGDVCFYFGLRWTPKFDSWMRGDRGSKELPGGNAQWGGIVGRNVFRLLSARCGSQRGRRSHGDRSRHVGTLTVLAHDLSVRTLALAIGASSLPPWWGSFPEANRCILTQPCKWRGWAIGMGGSVTFFHVHCGALGRCRLGASSLYYAFAFPLIEAPLRCARFVCEECRR